MKRSVVILGAGPTGIGAALELEARGHDDYLMLEGSSHPGGLASSYVDRKGFTWDVGGHVQFSHYERFDREMDSALGRDGWIYHERSSFIRIDGRFVPYPFQNNIRYLDEATRERCIAGLEEAGRRASSRKPRHFREWLLRTFGKGIFDLFLHPYNLKVWGYPLESLDWKWIGDRVSVVDVERVRENIRLQRDDVNWGPNNRFRFPKRGGTGAIWRSLAQRIPKEKLRFRTRVVGVDLGRRIVRVSGGREIGYEKLISTLPLDELCTLTRNRELKALGRKLVYSSANIVGVGMRGQCPENLRGKCWMYFPESDSPFYRVTVFSTYSPNNVPDPEKYWSLMTETSESPHKKVDQRRLVKDAVQGLKNTKLIGEDAEIVSTWKFRAPHGYPTPFVGRDAILSKIHKRLNAHGVYSRGRFGGWKYEVSNQDHSFMQGVELVGCLLSGDPEPTYDTPEIVNRGKK